MNPHKNLLRNYRAFAQPRKIRAADKGTFDALGSGMLVISTWASDRSVEIMLKDTLYAPSIAFTLISLGRCDDTGYQARIAYQKCAILSTAGTLLMHRSKNHSCLASMVTLCGSGRSGPSPVLSSPLLVRAATVMSALFVTGAIPGVDTCPEVGTCPPKADTCVVR